MGRLQIVDEVLGRIVIHIGAKGETAQHVVEFGWDVGKKFLQIDHPVAEHDRTIDRRDATSAFWRQRLHRMDTHPGNKLKDVAEAEKIEPERTFPKIERIVEVDPAIMAVVVIDIKMVAADIAVLFPLAVQPADGPAGFDEAGQNVREKSGEIVLVRGFERLDPLIQALARNEVQNAHRIAVIVENGLALHETPVAPDQIEQAGFLPGTSGAGHGHGADGHGKALVEDEL